MNMQGHNVVFSPFDCNRKMIELIKFQLYASKLNNNVLAIRHIMLIVFTILILLRFISTFEVLIFSYVPHTIYI